MPTRGRIVVVTSDQALVKDISGGPQGGAFEVAAVASAAEAQGKIERRTQSRVSWGLAVDLLTVPASDAETLSAAALQTRCWVPVLLEPEPSFDPAQTLPLRTLGWPLPADFVDKVAAARRPVVFLVEKSVFLARAVELSFKPTGIQPVVMQSAEGLAEYLLQSRRPIAPDQKGLWDRFMETFAERPVPVMAPGTSLGAPVGVVLSHVVAARFDAGRHAAVEVDRRLRERIPDAVCYFVGNLDPVRNAAESLKSRREARLPRAQAELLASLLAAVENQSPAPAKPSILLVDRDIEAVAVLARALMAEGFRVEMARASDEAAGLVNAPGQFHAAVVGLSFAMSFSYGIDEGPNLARRLRAADPDLRLIFMVDLYPLERAVREMSRAIELGADDAVVKPVDPGRLLAGVERALQRRRMALAYAEFSRQAPAHGVEGVTPHPDNLVAGRYDLVFQIGEGGMGLVYLASDRQLGRKVALKRMRAEIKASPANRQRFWDEAKIISRLSHPYIVGVHEIIEHEGDLYLVLDYVDGKPLSDILAERRRLSLMESYKVLGHVCQGVEFAHRCHILHRDLKPSNILVDANGYSKVTDFGLAREIKEAVSLLTQKDMGGTLAYMAPEQHLGRCGRPSDVYSLGVCLYEMLTGELPFKGPDYLVQKERRLYKPAGQLAPNLPPGTDELIERVLDPEARGRLGSALGLAHELAKLAGVRPSRPGA